MFFFLFLLILTVRVIQNLLFSLLEMVPYHFRDVFAYHLNLTLKGFIHIINFFPTCLYNVFDSV